MSVGELLKVKGDEILEVAATYGAKNIRVFGSAARNQAGPSSDIDFLVEFEEGRSLLDQVGLGQDLAKLLGHPVDIVEQEGVHWYIRDKVLQEAVPL